MRVLEQGRAANAMQARWSPPVCAIAGRLNLWWIPIWGIEGAAAATLTSEAIWPANVVTVTRRVVGPLHWAWLKSVGPASVVAGVALALQLPGGELVWWTTAGLLYVDVLLVTGDSWPRPRTRITPGRS